MFLAGRSQQTDISKVPETHNFPHLESSFGIFSSTYPKNSKIDNIANPGLECQVRG